MLFRLSSLKGIFKDYKMNHIQQIVYINLDRRTDRRSEMEQQLRDMGLSGERFSAIQTDPGFIGCAQSHLAVLELARDRGWDNVLVLEDDFLFLFDREGVDQRLNAFFDLKIPYDVLMFGHNIQKSEPYNNVVCRAINVQSATGYLVHSRFYDTLINTFRQAVPLLSTTHKHWLYANDQSWKCLQPISQWFCMNVRMGRNRPGYSDLGRCYVDHPDC
jgi:hypothetical protein